MEQAETQNRLANSTITSKDIVEALERVGRSTSEALTLSRQSGLDAASAIKTLTVAINTFNELGFPKDNC